MIIHKYTLQRFLFTILNYRIISIHFDFLSQSSCRLN
uniref:Uncharacterized protein n=1 Tax=Tetranychus urticae TaxID=32264 RepID=T1L0T9_TETUR